MPVTLPQEPMPITPVRTVYASHTCPAGPYQAYLSRESILITPVQIAIPMTPVLRVDASDTCLDSARVPSG